MGQLRKLGCMERMKRDGIANKGNGGAQLNRNIPK